MTGKERQRPWRARASNPKSRTGCLSCKKRKVKCDEGKPHCLRCLKFGVVCDGYIAFKSASSSVLRSLIPVSSSQTTPIRSNPNTTHFENEQEHCYFESFCEQEGPRIKGAFTVSSIWSSIVLQASYSEPGIRQAIAATGALVRKLDAGTSPSYFDKHLSSALQYYQQALRAMRDIKNIRTALVACLLVFNFETLIRRMDLAVKTAQSGFKLLNDLLKKSRRFGEPATLFPNSEKEVGLFKAYQRSKTLASVSSIPEIEDELIEIFVSLDVLLLPVTGVPRLYFRRPSSFLSSDGMASSIPAKFSTIDDARVCLGSLLGGHGREFKNHQEWTAFAPTLQTSESSGMMVVDFRPKRWMTSSGATETNASGIRKVARDNSLWYRAFEHLPNTISDSDSEDYMAAILLQLHSKITCLLLFAIMAGNECGFDKFSTEFNEIISLCEKYFALPDSRKPSVSLGYGVLFPLLVIATRCRDWTIRRRALSLLGIDQMELWDSKLVTQAAAWHMEVEEASRIFGEYIPEESRLRCGKLTLDFQNKRAWYSGFYLKDDPEDETTHLVTELVWK